MMESMAAPQPRQGSLTVRETRELAIDSGISTSSDQAQDVGSHDAGKKSVNPTQTLHARKASTSEKSKKQFGGIGLGGPSTGASRPVGTAFSYKIDEGSRNATHRQSPSLSLSGRMPSGRRASIASHSPTSPPHSFSTTFNGQTRSSYNSKFKQIQSQTLSGRLLNYFSRHSPRQILLGLLFFGMTIFFLASLLGYGSSRSAGRQSSIGHNTVVKGNTRKGVQGEYEELSGARYAQEAIKAVGEDGGSISAGRARPARIPKEPFRNEDTYKDGVEASSEFAEVAAKKLPPLAMRKQRLSPAERQREEGKHDDVDEHEAVAVIKAGAGGGSEADMFERNLALNRARQGAS